MKLKLKVQTRKSNQKLLDIGKLKDTTTRLQFQLELSNRFLALANSSDDIDSV